MLLHPRFLNRAPEQDTNLTCSKEQGTNVALFFFLPGIRATQTLALQPNSADSAEETSHSPGSAAESQEPTQSSS